MARPLEVAVRGSPRPAVGPRLALAERYCQVRFATEALCDPLSPDDLSVQSMPEARPVKWHLGHTSWFFERHVLLGAWSDYAPYNRAFDELFGSDLAAEHGAKDLRALASRPAFEEILDYRRHVDAYVLAILCTDDGVDPELEERLALGLHHERQHQERLLADIKHALSQGPLRQTYLRQTLEQELLTSHRPPAPLTYERYATTLTHVGHDGAGFASDHELPRHPVLVHGFELGQRLVSCSEYLAFMADGGYSRPELWLVDGWACAQRDDWRAPLYWHKDGDNWLLFTLGGVRELSMAEPVAHVSYYEAEAFARWSKARLATEQEWEVAAQGLDPDGNLAESGVLHPLPLADNDDAPGRRGPRQLFGDVWEWTQSPFVAYPGYRPLGDSHKLMCNQMVLRGGSCLTPRAAVNATTRGFLPPEARWQVTGIRLAR